MKTDIFPVETKERKGDEESKSVDEYMKKRTDQVHLELLQG